MRPSPRRWAFSFLFLFSTSALVTSCSSSPAAKSAAGADAIPVRQAALNADQYVGKKIKISGILTSSFSNGGRPTDPWVDVVAESRPALPTIGCVVGAKPADRKTDPRVIAEGTLVKDGDRVLLQDCTYTVVP